MKFQKKAQYDYEANGITEENGFTKWYHWEKVKTPARIMGYVFVALLFVLARVFKEELAAYGKMNVIITSVSALLTLIIIVVPLHELLHLLIMSCISSYTDIYMVFYILRHVSRNDIIFGMYKKDS